MVSECPAHPTCQEQTVVMSANLSELIVHLMKQQLKQAVHGVVVSYVTAGCTFLGAVYAWFRGRASTTAQRQTVGVIGPFLTSLDPIIIVRRWKNCHPTIVCQSGRSGDSHPIRPTA